MNKIQKQIDDLIKDIDRQFFYTLVDYNDNETSREQWKKIVEKKQSQLNKLLERVDE